MTASLLVCSTCLTGKCYNLHVTEPAGKTSFGIGQMQSQRQSMQNLFIYIVFIVHGDYMYLLLACFYKSIVLLDLKVLDLDSDAEQPHTQSPPPPPPPPTVCGNENGPRRGPFNFLLCQLHMQVVLSDISDLQQA